MAIEDDYLSRHILSEIDSELDDIVHTINRTADQVERQEIGAISPAKLRYDADHLSRIRRRIRLLLQDSETRDGVRLPDVSGVDHRDLAGDGSHCYCNSVALQTR